MPKACDFNNLCFIFGRGGWVVVPTYVLLATNIYIYIDPLRHLSQGSRSHYNNIYYDSVGSILAQDLAKPYARPEPFVHAGHIGFGTVVVRGVAGVGRVHDALELLSGTVLWRHVYLGSQRRPHWSWRRSCGHSTII